MQIHHINYLDKQLHQIGIRGPGDTSDFEGYCQ